MEYHQRKPTRAALADYSAAGRYFVTICTKNKTKILSSISTVGDDVLDVPCVNLSQYGKIVENRINEINRVYKDLEIEQYVIMPNHVHMIVALYDISAADNGTSRTSSPTITGEVRQHERIPKLVSTLKRYVNKEIGMDIWQRSFNDHIIRCKEDYDEVRKYIYNNPTKWYYEN